LPLRRQKFFHKKVKSFYLKVILPKVRLLLETSGIFEESGAVEHFMKNRAFAILLERFI
jgi:hypothetical protein